MRSLHLLSNVVEARTGDRASKSAALREIEGDQAYELHNVFLGIAVLPKKATNGLCFDEQVRLAAIKLEYEASRRCPSCLSKTRTERAKTLQRTERLTM